MEDHTEGGRIPPYLVIGMGTLRFGFVVGFSITAMPFLLSKAGVSVDQIGAGSATATLVKSWVPARTMSSYFM